MKKNYCRRRFSGEEFCERRLIGFGELGERGAESWEDKCESSTEDSSAFGEVGEVAATPTEKPVLPPPKPTFDEIQFNMHPDEPSHLLDDNEKVQKNPQHENRRMNRSQFKQHLRRMFGSSMKGQMGLEHERQHRLARGRRYAEARRRIPNTRQGRKERLAFVASHADDIYEQAEQEFQNMKKAPEQLFGEKQYETMLEQITNDIWSSDEFQRGSANYLQAYQKAWVLYTDLAKRQSYERDDIYEHPLFTSGPFTQNRAPGTYHGKLTQERAAFTAYRPTPYAQAKIREHAGTMDASDQELLNSLPAEASRKDPEEQYSAYDRLDARDRGPVIGSIVHRLGVSNIHTIKDFDKKVRLDLVELANMQDGFAQVLHYQTKAERHRGDPTKVKAGLAIIDRKNEDVTDAPDVHFIDFASAVNLRNNDVWVEGYLKSPEISKEALTVRDMFLRSLLTDSDAYNVDHYKQLVANCLKIHSIPFALDELQRVCDVNERATRLGQKLKNIFIDTDVFKEGTNWSDEHKNSFRQLKDGSSSADRELLKTITRERCVYPNGDIVEKDFESFWSSL